jgi:hypothetical protein
MWLQIMGAPDVVHRGLAYALLFRQGPATPMRHPRRFGLNSRIHDRRNLVDLVDRFPAPSRSNVPKAVQPQFAEPFPPKNYRVPVYRESSRDSGIALAVRSTEHDPASQRHLLRSSVRGNPFLDLLPLHW